MAALIFRTSLNFLALCCLLILSFVSQCKAQAQSLSANGQSEITVADAAEIFGIGVREIVIDGTLDLDMSTFENGLFGIVLHAAWALTSTEETLAAIGMHIAIAGNGGVIRRDVAHLISA